MKNERHRTIVGNPYALYYRTASNKSSNKLKAKRIGKATKLELQKKAGALQDAEEEQGIPNEGSSKNKKRARDEDEEGQAPVAAAPRPIKKASGMGAN